MNPSILIKQKWQRASFGPEQWQALAKAVLTPMIGLVLFIGVWHIGAKQVDTSLGQFPGPAEVHEQWQNLRTEHISENEREAAFYERQEQRNAKKLEQNPSAEVRWRDFNRRPTFFDQIVTSLITVMTGFFLATMIAIPLGIFIGLSNTVYRALNPIIQIFKPVSPLAWLPLVTMVVSAVYVSEDPVLAKSFITSVVTVTLCCLWPTMINTAVGVASINQDLQNVSRVLRLGWLTHIKTIVLPSSIPMMFTGLRLSLGIAWMVLIAAEMLAQNPGLGKFVWDEFQNGSSNSLGRICVAVLMIGFIGFLLDRALLFIQSWVNWDKTAVVR
ncbi:ABC transporter permease [Gilvimarinus agarilyticus]|uniref:ABC transporter permease n=1 Tax=Gilvimarinus sp. 2_MG-2023 TaxID=3062666 RepID=UPI001C090A53|nr:ABC transporter permease [Gilvimarinus sp. 2_MG-2023]MBU2885310.1 ABC transporter permease [Gilvimarinus agarilyticus]MDO6570209.1 ABC transporter permease [Gilvimarinus sp. 2_MG-2023]